MKITAKIISAMEKAGACEERIAWYKAEERDLKDVPHEDLRWVVCIASKPYKAQAAAALLADKPTHYDLRRVMCDAPEPYKAEAAKALLADNPTHDDLRWMVCLAPDPYKALAEKELSK